MLEDNKSYQYVITINNTTPKPPVQDIIEHVYGKDANVDTEGNSNPPSSTAWTFLYMKLRSLDLDEPLVEIYLEDDESSLVIISEDQALSEKTAKFLADQTGGVLLSTIENSS